MFRRKKDNRPDEEQQILFVDPKSNPSVVVNLPLCVINNMDNVGQKETDGSSSLSKSEESSETSKSDPFGSDFSELDPTYKNTSTSSSSSSSSDYEIVQTNNWPVRSPSKKRGRKRKQNKENWRKNLSKHLINSGASYKSIKVTKLANNNLEKKVVERSAKVMLPPCDRCRLKCTTKLTEETRKNIFEDYWKLSNLQRQRDYIASCMQTVRPKYSYTKEDRRKENHAFYFLNNMERIQVYKTFFISTLGVNTRIIRTVIEKQEQTASGIVTGEKTDKHKNHKTVANVVKEGVRAHINSIPRIDSHYCRADTSREYVEGTKTIAELHRDYKEFCQSRDTPPANYQMYYEIFVNEYNISFFHPKKDACELCSQFINANEVEKENLKE